MQRPKSDCPPCKNIKTLYYGTKLYTIYTQCMKYKIKLLKRSGEKHRLEFRN